MCSQSQHWFNRESHTFFDFGVKVLGVVVGDYQSGMKGCADAMASEVTDYSVVKALCVRLNNSANHIY